MKKYVLTTLLIIYSIMALHGQEKKAQAILDELAATTQSYSTVRIEFEYRMENKAQKINESYSGTLSSKGDSYRLDIAGQLIISDGKTVWTYLESANEVQISEETGEADGFSPTRFLQSWSNDYKPKSLKETGTEQIIELQPKKSSNFNKVVLTVNKSRKQINSLQLFDANGNIFTYLVKKFTTNQTIADREFSFIPKSYPGIEIIDLR